MLNIACFHIEGYLQRRTRLVLEPTRDILLIEQTCYRPRHPAGPTYLFELLLNQLIHLSIN